MAQPHYFYVKGRQTGNNTMQRIYRDNNLWNPTAYFKAVVCLTTLTFFILYSVEFHNNLKRMWKKVVVAYVKVLSQHSREGTKITKKPQDNQFPGREALTIEKIFWEHTWNVYTTRIYWLYE
jgi:hypothetical protein